MKIIINNWRLEPSQNALIHCETGEIQRLGEFHFILLETLIAHAGEVIPRSALIGEVWKNRVVGNNSLPTAIYALRVALGDDGRLQEIIKTVPKKGYVFNKEFIKTTAEKADEDVPAAVTATPVSEAETVALTPEAETETSGDPLPAPSPPAEPVPVEEKPFPRRLVWGIALLTVVILTAVTFILMKVNNAPAPVENVTQENPGGLFLLEEKTPDTERLSLFHLRHNNEEIHTDQLDAHMPGALKRIDQLLNTRQATLTIYYYNSIPKLSMDVIVTDRCQQQYQLIMGVQNWQANADKLGSLVYREVERTLNEMPVCQ